VSKITLLISTEKGINFSKWKFSKSHCASLFTAVCSAHFISKYLVVDLIYIMGRKYYYYSSDDNSCDDYSSDESSKKGCRKHSCKKCRKPICKSCSKTSCKKAQSKVKEPTCESCKKREPSEGKKDCKCVVITVN